MKIVLAIEGTDGSGKTSLASFMKRLCEQQGCSFTAIRRRGTNAQPAVARLSKILHEDAGCLSTPAEISIRLAREYQRAYLAAIVPSGLVILDRYVISVLSVARLYGLDVDPLVALLKEAVSRSHLYATVFVKCPFEVATDRVSKRNPQLSPRKNLPEAIEKRLAEFMEADFHRGVLTGQQWLVDNSQSPQLGEEQLFSYLRPILARVSTANATAIRLSSQSVDSF